MEAEGHNSPLHELVQPMVSEFIFQLSCFRPMVELTSLPVSDSHGRGKDCFSVPLLP